MKTSLRCISLALLTLLTACGGGGGGSSDNNTPTADACSAIGLSPKIIGGETCSNGSSAVVEVLLDYGGGKVGLCSGTLVTSTKVVTAGHCFNRVNLGVYVRNGATIKASNVKVHPEYRVTAEAVYNDVAIVTLSRPLNLPTLPLLLSQDVHGGNTVQVFGYGRTDQTGTDGVLRGGDMRLNDADQNLLYAYYSDGNSNTCFGDSGGPATYTVNGRTGLVGVTSTGSGQNCDPGELSLFTNLQGSSVMNFLTENIPGIGTF